MNFDEIVARAAPPPERADPELFEPAPTDPENLARRRSGLVRAFGSEDALAAHARALGLEPEAWIGRFADVRPAGRYPDWARAFRAIWERLSDAPPEFAAVRRWARDSALAAWPDAAPAGPDALEGPLDHLAGRLGAALLPTHHVERQLGGRNTWSARFLRSPALAYALGRVAADWLDDLLTMARRAADDRSRLARTFFGGEDPGALLRIEAGLGDPHAGGRSVAILQFDRGAVVYKPKDLRVATAVGEIAGRLKETGLAPPAPLIRNGYAWERVYETAPLAGGDDANAFFGALGGWLALLQALGGTDFWFDNLIACGRIPRFVDFETAVQPPPHWPGGIRPLAGEAAQIVATAPIGVGILPLLYSIGDGEDPTDLGCVARPGTHRAPAPVFFGNERASWNDSRFAPHTSDGRPVDAAGHFDAFEKGYFRVARSLAEPAQQEAAAATLRHAADAPVRIILIDTWTCYRIIHRSLAPRHLSDGAWREIALHAALPARDHAVGELREAAVRDLRRIDIPLFQTRLGSRDLFGVEGERLPNAFQTDAVSAAGNRLRFLAGLPASERAAWLRSGFGLRAGNPARRRPARARLSPARAEDLLAWSDGIAKEVARLAVRDDRGGPAWIGLVQDVFTGWRILGPIGFDVLSGRAGLSSALLELAGLLDRPELAALACEAAEATARDYIENLAGNIDFGAGYAVGAGGLVAVLAEAPGLRPLATETFRLASDREIWMRSGADFVSGLAGWHSAARALGETPPTVHGTGRPYAPSAGARLARWRAPQKTAPLCCDRLAAARLRQDRDRHGSWFADSWLDDRHNLSGIDGITALAVRFARLAAEPPETADGETPGATGRRNAPQ